MARIIGRKRRRTMTDLTAPFRRATADDATQMAELVNLAGEGLPLYLWAKFARPEQSAWDVGRERARLGLGGFAFPHTVVREVDGRAAACLIGYPRSDPLPTSGHEGITLLAPLEELGSLVLTSWYINILATFPLHRGKGFAAELLHIAEGRARDAQLPRISLIVSDANTPARRLYAGNGYSEFATRPIVKEDWSHNGRNWILLVKEL